MKLIHTIVISAFASSLMMPVLALSKQYVCPPCYHDEHTYKTKIYKHDGVCEICQMNLIESPPILANNKIELHEGSGNFYFFLDRLTGGKPIQIFYHKPTTFSSETQFLMVFTGTDRNAWDYRDDWIEISEEFDVLIVSPSYPVQEYGFNDYHLINMTTDISYNLKSKEFEKNKIHVDEESIEFSTINHKNKWLINDFDQIFKQLRINLGLKQIKYDVFGHSAGAQIIHRWAMFYDSKYVNHMVAANAGIYTLINESIFYPIGLKGVDHYFNPKVALSQKLLLMVGSLDNETETQGTMLHTKTLDLMGKGRLERAQSFIAHVNKYSQKNDIKNNWQLKIVSNVGHNHSLMAEQAANYLYR